MRKQNANNRIIKLRFIFIISSFLFLLFDLTNPAMKSVLFYTFIFFLFHEICSYTLVNKITRRKTVIVKVMPRELNGCLLVDKTDDQYLGSLYRNKSFYCTSRTQRVPANVRCCTPRDSSQVRLLISKTGMAEKEVKFYDQEGMNLLKTSPVIVYVVHGFEEKISTSAWVNRVRDAYVKIGAGVVVVDWGTLNQDPYFQAIANVRTVGAVVGSSILKWDVS